MRAATNGAQSVDLADGEKRKGRENNKQRKTETASMQLVRQGHNFVHRARILASERSLGRGQIDEQMGREGFENDGERRQEIVTGMKQGWKISPAEEEGGKGVVVGSQRPRELLFYAPRFLGPSILPIAFTLYVPSVQVAWLGVGTALVPLP